MGIKRNASIRYQCNTAGGVSKRTVADLQVTGEECGAFGFGQHGDLLEGQEVVDVDVVLCRRKRMKRTLMKDVP